MTTTPEETQDQLPPAPVPEELDLFSVQAVIRDLQSAIEKANSKYRGEYPRQCGYYEAVIDDAARRLKYVLERGL